jgi:hypothetical protein
MQVEQIDADTANSETLSESLNSSQAGSNDRRMSSSSQRSNITAIINNSTEETGKQEAPVAQDNISTDKTTA